MKRIVRKLLKLIKNPKIIMSVLLLKNAHRIKNDELYLKVMFWLSVGYKLNLRNPQTFNEKLNWLKLYYHNPIMSILADKYKVKEYVREKVGDQFVVPNYGVWDKFDDIDFSSLPSQFVLKTTNDSLGAIVCKDKLSFDKDSAKLHIEKGLKWNYYYSWREWGYKYVERRVIADKYLNDGTGKQLRDYKFWCFNGEPRYMYCTIKGENVYENFYDMDFNKVNINHGYPRHQPEFEKPLDFDVMKKLAKKLSSGLPFVRVDFFYVHGQVYFGEFTFYDWAGLTPFDSYETDLNLGKLLTLPAPML